MELWRKTSVQLLRALFYTAQHCDAHFQLSKCCMNAFHCWSCRQATLVHGPNATLVGTDEFGNKYYERMTEQYGARCHSQSVLTLSHSWDVRYGVAGHLSPCSAMP